MIGKKDGNDILSLTVELTKDMLEGPKQQLEFLAKTLLQSPFLVKNEDRPIQSPQSHVVLGTPIYVAIDD